MDICGEHGDEIAYAGLYCPACSQIEEIQDDNKNELREVQDSMQEDIDNLLDQIEELKDKE